MSYLFGPTVSDISKPSLQNGGVHTNTGAGPVLSHCAAMCGHFALEKDSLLL